MIGMSPLSKNKKAISAMVAYVVLIAITISLSTLVYNWLKFQFGAEEEPSCPEGVNLIIRNYECSEGSWLELDLVNRGRFTAEGYVVRVHNRSDATFGIYTLNETGSAIPPGDNVTHIYMFSEHTENEIKNIGSVKFVEVQPYVTLSSGEKLLCLPVSNQKLDC